jgi:hypothetical protein
MKGASVWSAYNREVNCSYEILQGFLKKILAQMMGDVVKFIPILNYTSIYNGPGCSDDEGVPLHHCAVRMAKRRRGSICFVVENDPFLVLDFICKTSNACSFSEFAHLSPYPGV